MSLHTRLLRTVLQTLALTFVVAFGLSGVLWADAPGRVARLSDFAGDVQLANDREDWHPIARNFPVTAGDNVWVSDGGRAELDVGALQLWLASGSNVYFDRFDDHNLVARLTDGALAVRIRAWEAQDAMRVLTNAGEISLQQPGFYVVSAAGQYAPVGLTVRSGLAEVYVNGVNQLINAGESVLLDAGGARFGRYASANGGFEAWALARDRRYERWASRPADGISPWMIGARELDDYGYWDNTYEYGRVWYPATVASGWAPYRYGRWSWVQPWGWTWVDDAAWGFAPFHYGRWVRIGGRWGWCPGYTAGRPVYAPALVTFFGGNGWSVGANLGPTYSWVPLGWNEPYVPWYTYSPVYWRQVNRPYVRNIAEEPWRPQTYVHAAVPGAITAVAGAAFIAGRPVAQNLVRNIAERDIRSAPPARMGEVLPQFQPARGVAGGVVGNPPVAVPGPAGRPVDPNPVVGARPPIIRERARELGPASVQPGVPQAALVPNTNVAQPRVWQDPNPVVGRLPSQPAQPIPAGQASPVQVQRPAVVSENPGLRAPATPMSKDFRERAIQRGQAPQVIEPRADLPQQRAVVVPQAVAPSAQQMAPAVRVAPAPAPTPRVVETRPPVVNAGPVVERAPQEQRRAAEPQHGREKDRAPAAPQHQQ